MPQYIQIISKLKPKNEQSFKLMDVTDIDVDVNTQTYNVLCVQNDTFVSSGINWDVSQGCTIGGNLHLSGNLYQYSDRNLKQNIIPIHSALNIVNSLQGVEFNWINTEKHDYGVIAQEIQKIIPQSVIIQEKTGFKQVNYIKIIPFLIQAINQLSKRVLELQEKTM